jgi:hypothetical protein
MSVADWVGFINGIQGLGKAVSELIGDVNRLGSAGARLGIAKVDAHTIAIEDETARRSSLSNVATEAEIAMIKAIGNAAVDYVQMEARQLGERAAAYGIHRMLKEQQNREVVVTKTIENLQLSPPETAPKSTPSNDWLKLFGRYAELATSEKMREHWASILEGEIRKPGSFSFAALHLASIMDEKLARRGTMSYLRPLPKDQALLNYL